MHVHVIQYHLKSLNDTLPSSNTVLACQLYQWVRSHSTIEWLARLNPNTVSLLALQHCQIMHSILLHWLLLQHGDCSVCLFGRGYTVWTVGMWSEEAPFGGHPQWSLNGYITERLQITCCSYQLVHSRRAQPERQVNFRLSS